VLIVKISEDEFFVIYSYSHDSDILDGTIKIDKSILNSENEKKIFRNFVEIKDSATDKNSFFAMRAASGICLKIYRGEILEFPERHMFAWG